MVPFGVLVGIAGIIALFMGAIGPGLAFLVLAWVLIGIGVSQ